MMLHQDDLHALRNTPLLRMIQYRTAGEGATLASKADLDLSVDQLSTLLDFANDEFGFTHECTPVELAVLQSKIDEYLNLPKAWWALSQSREVQTDKVSSPQQFLEQVRQKNVQTRKNLPIPFSFDLAPDCKSMLCTAAYQGEPPGNLFLESAGQLSVRYEANRPTDHQQVYSVWTLPLPDFTSSTVSYVLRWDIPKSVASTSQKHFRSWVHSEGGGRRSKDGSRQTRKEDRLANLATRRKDWD
jgi:hypothetical protein